MFVYLPSLRNVSHKEAKEFHMKALMLALVAVFAVSSVSFASGHDKKAKKPPVNTGDHHDGHAEEPHKEGEPKKDEHK